MGIFRYGRKVVLVLRGALYYRLTVAVEIYFDPTVIRQGYVPCAPELPRAFTP